ncbi:hypothetical protein J2Y67_003909 [Neobacillus niacini]|nr:hypothetical protein [Neobacillus niacini]
MNGAFDTKSDAKKNGIVNAKNIKEIALMF